MNRAELRELYMQCITHDPRLDLERVARALDQALDAIERIAKHASEPNVRSLYSLPDAIDWIDELNGWYESECEANQELRGELSTAEANTQEWFERWRRERIPESIEPQRTTYAGDLP